MRMQHAYAVIAGFMLLAASCAPASAREYQCSVVDSVGDADLSPGQGFDGRPYQDVVATGITRTTGAVVFSMEVAAPIPSSPMLRTPNGLLLWMWGMNTGPGVPQGFPLSPGLAGLLEYWIHLAWNGREFYAEVIDRRAELQGGAPIVTRVPFLVNGTRIQVFAIPALFDDPSEFRWGTSTWIWSTHLGSAAAHVVDRAPNGPASTCVAN